MLPVYTLGVAIAFPILTLAMLDLFPDRRGAASSVQSFVQLTLNAVIAGAWAPFMAQSLLGLAVNALVVTLVAWVLWARHLRVARPAPEAR